MKVEAFQCDCCNELKVYAEVVGISLQPDLFDIMSGYKVVGNPNKEKCHLCTKCYNEKALFPAQNLVNRKKDEKAYELKLKEMSYMVRLKCVENFNKKLRKDLFGK